MVTSERLSFYVGCSIFWIVFVWSAIKPNDYSTWALETLPALLAMIAVICTRKRFPLTPLVYVLILIHSIVLMVGGHYTYAQVPFFEQLKQAFAFERNNYDKLGHFMQGFEPAILAREILLRLQVVGKRGWLNFIVLSVCLAFSAFYEMIEWWVAILSEDGAESFLGTQGYVWDTQSDMAFAGLGAVCALFFLSREHDRQLRYL